MTTERIKRRKENNEQGKCCDRPAGGVEATHTWDRCPRSGKLSVRCHVSLSSMAGVAKWCGRQCDARRLTFVGRGV